MANEYLDRKFDWSDPQHVSAHDDLPVWSALGGTLLLEHVPMRPDMTVLDVGCGTGFPLLELAERIGTNGKVIGIDPWEAALERARFKAKLRKISNVEVVHGDAAALPWNGPTFDLIVSNFGINNFQDQPRVLAECGRVAKKGAHIAMTTNLRGHMREFYEVFESVLTAAGQSTLIPSLRKHIDHRATIDGTNELLARAGFRPSRTVEQTAILRFASGSAMLHHSLIVGGFMGAWRKVVQESGGERNLFTLLERELNTLAKQKGEIRLSIPMAYIEAVKL